MFKITYLNEEWQVKDNSYTPIAGTTIAQLGAWFRTTFPNVIVLSIMRITS